MKTHSLRFLISTTFASMVLALATTSALALDTAALDQQVAATLNQFYALNDQNKHIVNYAVGVLVIPTVTKAGLGVGGYSGDGALLQNGKTTGYYARSGASVGLTAGASQHSEVIVFNTQDALNKITGGGDWAFGADTSVAVMTVGAGGRYDSQSLSRPVDVYIFGNKGLMGDVSLKGGKIHKISP